MSTHVDTHALMEGSSECATRRAEAVAHQTCWSDASIDQSSQNSPSASVSAAALTLSSARLITLDGLNDSGTFALAIGRLSEKLHSLLAGPSTLALLRPRATFGMSFSNKSKLVVQICDLLTQPCSGFTWCGVKQLCRRFVHDPCGSIVHAPSSGTEGAPRAQASAAG